MLAEFGAEVIKIEPPRLGDPLRKWRKLHDGTSLWWYAQARNKKSVTLDLKQPEAQEIVRKLAAGADIVVENFRPGAMEKWGLGWEALSAVNPGLIMVRLSGFGQTGPYRDRPGFGAIGESMGGLRYVTGYPGPAAGARRGVDRRLHRGAARRDRRADGAASPQRERRPRPVRRRRALRGGVQHDGERAAGVRHARLRARAERRLAPRHRPVQHLRRRATTSTS